jgi:hypothetical protein
VDDLFATRVEHLERALGKRRLSDERDAHCVKPPPRYPSLRP